MNTPSKLIHRAAGSPPHKYTEEVASGVCATCASSIKAGVSTEQINNPTFSNHAEFFRFGTHVCRACAWMYSEPKQRHRNMIACGGERPKVLYPMISPDSATEERPTWQDIIYGDVNKYLPILDDVPITGVLTTDPKPRLWPRCRVASVSSFGLYVHAPQYDVSEWRELDWDDALLEAGNVIRDALEAGYAKRRIYHGLLADYARVKRNIREAVSLEKELAIYRSLPEFVPALLTTQVSKEEKAEWKERYDGSEAGEGTGDTGRVVGRRETRGQAREDNVGLF